MNYYPFTTLLFIISTMASFVEARTFTSADGRTMEAEVISVTNTSTILKRGTRQYTIPLTSLSEADQKFLADWRAEKLKTIIPKLEVDINSGKSDRSDRNDSYDDRIGSFEFSVTIENAELHYSLESGKAELIVLGESCSHRDRYCIMQKNSFDVALEDGGTYEWKGEEFAYKFDNRSPTLWGYQYYGFAFVLKNADGTIIYQRVTPSKFEWGTEKLLEMKAKTAFDRTFKTHGSASIHGI